MSDQKVNNLKEINANLAEALALIKQSRSIVNLRFQGDAKYNFLAELLDGAVKQAEHAK